jgi:hypothetical protein
MEEAESFHLRNASTTASTRLNSESTFPESPDENIIYFLANIREAQDFDFGSIETLESPPEGENGL